MSDAALTMTEGVLLSHALVARLAEKVGARVLFIKGPTAVAVGARPDRPSTDVDVLVDPVAFDDLCGAFERAGWQLRTPIGLRHAGDLAFEHSAHYIHRDWPSDVDLHYNFPGFLASPEEVFEALWERRTAVPVAGRDVPTPDVLGQALVVGLHALRDASRDNSRADLAFLASHLAGMSLDRAWELARLARDTGSSGSAVGLLDLVGVSPLPLTQDEARRLGDWQLRQFGLGRSTAWLAEIQQAPLRHKAGAVLRALLPPRAYLVGSHAADDLTRGQLVRLHVTRWVRGVAALPRASALLRRRRQIRRGSEA